MKPTILTTCNASRDGSFDPARRSRQMPRIANCNYDSVTFESFRANCGRTWCDRFETLPATISKTRHGNLQGQNFSEIRITGERRNSMKILIITAIMALPLMALGQTTEPQQTQPQTKETQTTAPAKGKKKHAHQPGQPQAKPEAATDVRGQTNVKGSAQDVNRN